MEIYANNFNMYSAYKDYYFKNEKEILRISLNKDNNIIAIQIVDNYPLSDKLTKEEIISQKELFIKIFTSIRKMHNIDRYRKIKTLSCIFKREIKKILKY